MKKFSEPIPLHPLDLVVVMDARIATAEPTDILRKIDYPVLEDGVCLVMFDGVMYRLSATCPRI